jgi:hypothetical protein
MHNDMGSTSDRVNGRREFFQVIYIEQIIILPIEKNEKTDNKTVLPLSGIVYCKETSLY